MSPSMARLIDDLHLATVALAFGLESLTTTDEDKRERARDFLLALARYQARDAATMPRAQHIEFARHWYAGRDEGEALRTRFPDLRAHLYAAHAHRIELAHELERDWIAARHDRDERLRVARAIIAFVAEHTEPVARSIADHADSVQFAAIILQRTVARSTQNPKGATHQ